jgi:AcrR family transcriptional regulator
MQEIANEAGINKSLLHYYFRSKDRLFDAIFREAFSRFIPQSDQIMISDGKFSEKIIDFVRAYMNLLKENPYIPQFIIHELNMNPEHIMGLMNETGIEYKRILNVIDSEIKRGNIRPVDSRHFLVNLLSLCIFPFIARQILQRTILSDYNGDFERFLEERKREIPEFIINSIKIR